MSDSSEIFYSHDRARRLRWLLAAIGAIAVMTAVAALIAPNAADSGDAPTDQLISTLLFVAALMLLSAGTAAWLLGERTRSARRACILTGVLALLSALPTSGFIVGLLFAFLGVGILALAIPTEDLSSEGPAPS